MKAFQFRAGDEVKFTLFEQEMSGQVLRVLGDVLLVQLLEDRTVNHQIFTSRVKEVRREGAIYFLDNQQ